MEKPTARICGHETRVANGVRVCTRPPHWLWEPHNEGQFEPDEGFSHFSSQNGARDVRRPHED
jgi:hypothetical protein